MCTGIKIDYDKGCVMGRTMDYEVPINYNVLYFPRGYHYADDLFGEKLYSSYRTMGLCFENHNPLKDGINEHGLIGITNEFTGFNLYSKRVEEGKINISSLDYMNYALMNYRSVEEVIEDLPNFHMSTRNTEGKDIIAPDFHFMFTDRTKRTIVVEPKKGRLVYYDNPYGVMTNSPAFPSHERRLKKTFDLDNLESFNSAKDLPGGYDPVSRFLKAFYLTRMNHGSEGYKEALGNAYNIMNAMTMTNGFVRNKKYDSTTYTRYICMYDTSNLLLTVRTYSNPTVYKLSFDDIEDLDRREEFYINEDFVMESF